MLRAVPMVRAMSLVPAVRWLKANGRDPEPLLRRASLASAPFGDPLRPVSLLSVGRLLRAIAQAEGPDVACRIVTDASVFELALLGRVALGTSTPVEALARIAAALPLFCSYEHVSLHPGPEQLVVRHSYGVRFEPETEHLMLQYAVAMADRLCGMTGAAAPRLARVEIPPHPVLGVEHLRRWFGAGVTAKAGHALSIWIDQATANRRFPTIARDRMIGARPTDMVPLRGDGTLSGSVRIMLTSMLEDGVPSLRQLADAAGTSARTLQRRLAGEGTSFALLLDKVRQDRALRQLAVSNASVLSIATELGYERQASLTRAMRRWMGAPPTLFRKHAGVDRAP
jgi:AraC-like DNA-binding protein